MLKKYNEIISLCLRNLSTCLISKENQTPMLKRKFISINKELTINKVKTTSEKTLINNAGYFPSIIKSANELLLFYRSGAGHLGQNGHLSLMKSKDGLEWQTIKKIAYSNTDIRNPAATVLDDKTGYLATYKYDAYYGPDGIAEPSNNNSKFSMHFFRSDPSFENWHEDTSVIVNSNKVFSPHGKILKKDGKLFLPVYSSLHASVLVSQDNGYSWDCLPNIAYGYREPALTIAPDGHLIAVLRGNGSLINSSATWLSHSYDNGESWRNPEIISEGSAHPADIITLSNGYILLTVGARNPKKQRVLAYVSKDNGLSWNNKPLLLSQIYQNNDFGYPSTVEAANGMLYTVYYNKEQNSSRFSFNDPERYEEKGACTMIISYTIEQLEQALARLN